MILYGDIGGTKTQFLLATQLHRQPLQSAHYENQQFRSFYALLEHHLESLDGKVEKLFLSVAGPVTNNRCQLTNLNWFIDGEQIAKTFRFSDVQLLNDLAATAYAIPVLHTSDYVSLQSGQPLLENGPIAIISVGTGLGESVIFWESDLKRYRTLGGEGGHRNFAPRTQQEQSLSEYMQKKHRVSFFDTEKLISGQGLTHIYNYVQSTNATAEPGQTAEPWQIVERAKNSSDAAAIKSVDIFVDLIASEAANVALQYYSSGGVIIAGGIPAKISQLIDAERFVSRFREHASFSTWLGSIPLLLCTNYYAPLLGLDYFANNYQA